MTLSASIVDARLALPVLRAPVGRGRRAVPRFDEDAVTLAAEASLDLAGRWYPRALVLATVSGRRAEGGSAPVLAEMLDIHGMALELGGTVAAGGGALVAAAALAAAGIGPVLAVAADARTDPEGRPLGAGAVAFILDVDGDGGTLASTGDLAGWFPDVWRADGSAVVTYGDRSFAGHAPSLDADVVVGPTGPEIDRAGVLGCAALGAALLLGAPDDGVELTAAVSAGGIGHAFRLTGGPATARLRHGAGAALAGGNDGDVPEPVDLAELQPYASGPRSWRERGQDLRLEGARDIATGEVWFPAIPPQPGVELEPVRLARTGRVVTHTRDHVYPVGGPISMVVADLDGGGRFYGQTAWDFPVEIGMPVRLVPRLLHLGGGVPQYFWKVVPGEVG